MATRLSRFRAYPLGTFGLLLVLLVGKLAPHAAGRGRSNSARMRRWLARRALDGIEAIGWFVDRLPPAVRRKARAGRLKAATGRAG